MPSTTANSERRHNSRKRPASLIYVELSSTNGGMMRDLSEDGFALRAMMPLRVGEEISFSFLLDPLTRIEGHAAVLWIEENGRVAGVRFADLPAVARTDIRSWLNDELESQESERAAPAESDAQSFERLREELRSSPPRPESPKPKVSKSKWPVKAPETVQASSLSRELSNGIDAVIAESGNEREPADSGRLSETPRFPAAERSPEISLGPAEPSNASVRSTSAPGPPPRRPEVAHFPNRSAAQSPNPPLPDISQILMQPPRRQGGFGVAPPRLEPLDPVHPHRIDGRREGFTLSKALGIMVLLALGVSLLVYHDAVGQSLIWLGHQIGGTQGTPGTQLVSPPAGDEASTGAVNPMPANSNPPAAAAPPPNTTPPEKSPEETNAAASSAAASSPDPKPQPSLPKLENSSKPPVTPLSGFSSPATDGGGEAGQIEYTQAMQLLHDGVATDTSEAVRLLWISVEKGNPNAELTLAELYWRGQGVTRNCDQTGILLGAAARKGNVDAQKRLRQFRQEGCE